MKEVCSCPVCGQGSGCIALVAGFVRVCTHHCKICGKVWRECEILVPFCVNAFIVEIERLHRRFPTCKPDHVKHAIHHLQNKVDDHQYSKMEEDAARQKRRLDVWEKQFMRACLQEDYDY